MPLRPQRLTYERPLESGVGPASPAPLPHLVGVQEPEIQGISSAAIPIGGSATAAVEVSASGSAAIPIGGTATGLTVEIAATSTKAIPIGGDAQVTIEVRGTSTKAIPIGGTATGTAPMPLLSTLSDPLDDYTLLWLAQNSANANSTQLAGSARAQIVAVAGTGNSHFNSRVRYDAQNARWNFRVDLSGISVNDKAGILFSALGVAGVFDFRFVRTGAGTGTASIYERGALGGSGAFDPDTDTFFRIEFDNTTYGVVDAVRLYKSDGAGGWTLIAQKIGGMTIHQLNATIVGLRFDKLVAVTETTQVVWNEVNTILGTSSKAIPIGGTPTATVEVRGTGSAAIPIAGAATSAVEVQATTTRAIPIGGVAAAAVAVYAGSSKAIPIAGSATGTVEVRGAASGAIPLAGAASGVVEVRADTTLPIPIAGSATGTVASGASPVLATTNLPIPISGSAAGTVENPGGAHSRWRILVTGNAGIYAPSFAEVEFRASVGGADQATGGTPSASSVFGGFPATLGFDDNIGTLWSAAVTGLPQWLAYQFTGAVSVGEVFLRSRNDVSNEGPSAFSVQYSDDGITWVTYWSESGQAWAGAGTTRAFAAPAATISAQTTRAIPIGGTATGTVVTPTPPWERTDLGPDVIGGDLPTTTFIGLGPVAGLPRDNNTTTIAPPAQVFDGVSLSYNQIVVNPAGFAGLIVGESVQRNSGTGFPSLLPLILTFGTPVRGFKVTARTVDFDTGSMTAKDAAGNVLATVFFPVVGLAGASQSITREIQMGSNVIKTIELLPDSADYIAWNDMYLTVNHASGVGGWEETDLDIGVFAWAGADDAPATAWSN